MAVFLLATKLIILKGQEGAKIQRYALADVPSCTGKSIPCEELG